MRRATALTMAMLLTAVSLAGCMGDDTELNAANETIAGLDEQAGIDQANIADLEVQVGAYQAQIADLESQVGAHQAQITDLESQAEIDEARIAELEAAIAILEDAQEDYMETIAELNLAINESVAAQSVQYQNGYVDGAASVTARFSTLDDVLSRGSLKCGVKESHYGMGYLDSSTGVRSGLDIEYCRAIAAAIGLNPATDIEYVPVTSSNRFDNLASGAIDVLIRTTTWTTQRDADFGADFGAVNFYDGQSLMVREDAFAYGNGSATQLNNANICVAEGTTTQSNLQDWFSARGISFVTVDVIHAGDATDKFKSGQCDAFASDMTGLIAHKWNLDNDVSWTNPGIWIIREIMDNEAMSSATRDYDSDWNEVVSWVWYGMVRAEELGVTSQNYDTKATEACDTSNSWANYDGDVCRLLDYDLGLGTVDNPLPETWMQDVLEAVGNYGEVYDRAFCDGTFDGLGGSDAMTGCLVSRSGTANALVSEGGLQFTPSLR